MPTVRTHKTVEIGVLRPSSISAFALLLALRQKVNSILSKCSVVNGNVHYSLNYISCQWVFSILHCATGFYAFNF